MTDQWQPKNLGGSIYHDPQRELAYWISIAGNHPMVAVPVATLVACLRRQECSARTMINSDEDGPLATPIEIICRQPEDHHKQGIIRHHNGYTSWEEGSSG